MDAKQVRQIIGGMKASAVARRAKELGHAVSRQNVEYFQRNPSATPTYPVFDALRAVAVDRDASTEAHNTT